MSLDVRPFCAALLRALGLPSTTPIKRKHLKNTNDQGANNDIVFLELASKRYVVRVPRSSGGKTKEEKAEFVLWTVCITEHLRRNGLSSVIPKTLGYGYMEQNLLGRQYWFLERSPGVALSNITLSDEKAQRRLVRSMVRFLERMEAISMPSFGYIGADTTAQPVAAGMNTNIEMPRLEALVLRLDSSQRNWVIQETPPASSTRTNLKELLIGHIVGRMNQQGKDELPKLRAARLNTMKAVKKCYYFRDIPTSDCIPFHPDLTARNVLVDPETGAVTAVVDWDLARARPRALTRSARYISWVWNPEATRYSSYESLMRNGNGKIRRYMRKVLEAKMPGYWNDILAGRRQEFKLLEILERNLFMDETQCEDLMREIEKYEDEADEGYGNDDDQDDDWPYPGDSDDEDELGDDGDKNDNIGPSHGKKGGTKDKPDDGDDGPGGGGGTKPDGGDGKSDEKDTKGNHKATGKDKGKGKDTKPTGVQNPGPTTNQASTSQGTASATAATAATAATVPAVPAAPAAQPKQVYVPATDAASFNTLKKVKNYCPACRKMVLRMNFQVWMPTFAIICFYANQLKIQTATRCHGAGTQCNVTDWNTLATTKTAQNNVPTTSTNQKKRKRG
jgi:hypothetical protein